MVHTIYNRGFDCLNQKIFMELSKKIYYAQ